MDTHILHLTTQLGGQLGAAGAGLNSSIAEHGNPYLAAAHHGLHFSLSRPANRGLTAA